jgi:hypothetical protein
VQNVDLRERLGELARTLTPRRDRYCGADPTGAVQVEFAGGRAPTATVRLAQHWRRTVGVSSLGPAVLAAVHAAATARLTTWASGTDEDQREHPSAPRPEVPVEQRTAPPDLETVTRAWRDLREFASRLTELHSAPSTIHSSGQHVAVTVQAGAITVIHVDQSLAEMAQDSEIERILTDTINRAFAAIAALPERALDGCPDLRRVLTAHGAGPNGPR